jgi:hypothetical protein
MEQYYLRISVEFRGNGVKFHATLSRVEEEYFIGIRNNEAGK